MSQHIYAFGSVCRGEIDTSSDIDLLAIVHSFDDRFDPNQYSVYSYSRINELWKEGNPFAWHLYLESKLIYADDEYDFIKNKDRPSKYKNGIKDCEKFRDIFLASQKSLSESQLTQIYDLSTIFLSIRNFATCYSLTKLPTPDFSRNSAKNLVSDSVPIDEEAYHILERSRLLCTRGKGDLLDESEITKVQRSFHLIDQWMSKLIKKVKLS